MRCGRFGLRGWSFTGCSVAGLNSTGDWPCGPVPIFRSEAKSTWGQAPAAPDPPLLERVADTQAQSRRIAAQRGGWRHHRRGRGEKAEGAEVVVVQLGVRGVQIGALRQVVAVGQGHGIALAPVSSLFCW